MKKEKNNPLGKWAKDLSKLIMKDEGDVTNKHLKIGSTSLVARENKIKTHREMSRPKEKKRLTISNISKDVIQLELSKAAGRNVYWHTSENCWPVSTKASHTLWPSHSPPLYPRKCTHIDTKRCLPNVDSSSVSNCQNCKQPKYSIAEWISGWYYIFIQWNTTQQWQSPNYSYSQLRVWVSTNNDKVEKNTNKKAFTGQIIYLWFCLHNSEDRQSNVWW